MASLSPVENCVSSSSRNPTQNSSSVKSVRKLRSGGDHQYDILPRHASCEVREASEMCV